MWWTLIHKDGTVTHVTDANYDVRSLLADFKNGWCSDTVRIVRGRVFPTLSGAVVE